MKRLGILHFFAFIILLLPTKALSQDTLASMPSDTIVSITNDTIASNASTRVRPFLNVGYVTNLQKCSDCIQADRGFSVRIGLLTHGRFGFYVGYLWFKEYHTEQVGYDDKGAGLLAGLDFMLLKRGDFRWYVNLGIFNEKFTSTYPGGSETETSVKPDFGVLFNFSHFNASLGWQPSEPHHINLGIGVTF